MLKPDGIGQSKRRCRTGLYGWPRQNSQRNGSLWRVINVLVELDWKSLTAYNGMNSSAGKRLTKLMARDLNGNYLQCLSSTSIALAARWIYVLVDRDSLRSGVAGGGAFTDLLSTAARTLYIAAYRRCQLFHFHLPSLPE